MYSIRNGCDKFRVQFNEKRLKDRKAQIGGKASADNLGGKACFLLFATGRTLGYNFDIFTVCPLAVDEGWTCLPVDHRAHKFCGKNPRYQQRPPKVTRIKIVAYLK